MDKYSIIYLISFAMVFVFTGLALTAKVYKKLEKNHFKKYEEIGSPTLFVKNSIGGKIRFQKFLYGKEYLELNDANLAKLCVALRWMQSFWIVFIVLYLWFVIPIAFA